MTDLDLPEHVKRNRDLWDRWAKDYAQVGARAWAGAEPSWGTQVKNIAEEVRERPRFLGVFQRQRMPAQKEM